MLWKVGLSPNGEKRVVRDFQDKAQHATILILDDQYENLARLADVLAVHPQSEFPEEPISGVARRPRL